MRLLRQHFIEGIVIRYRKKYKIPLAPQKFTFFTYFSCLILSHNTGIPYENIFVKLANLYKYFFLLFEYRLWKIVDVFKTQMLRKNI